ncbi:MAG: DUF6494 family protein [Rhodomicrobium sp.]
MQGRRPAQAGGIERGVHEQHLTSGKLKVRAFLTAEGTDLHHIVEDKIDLPQLLARLARPAGERIAEQAPGFPSRLHEADMLLD